MKTIGHWIDGKTYDRPAERSGDVYNPATGEVQAKVAFATPAVVDEAVESAHRTFQTWRSVSIAKRTKILFAFRQLVDKHQKELAHLLTLEHGKVTGDALGEVNRGLEVIEFACGIADLALCNADSECGDGRACVAGRCAKAGCQAASDCGTGLECDPSGGGLGSGACFDPSAMPGDPCMGDSECGAGATCITEQFNGWVGGYCVIPECDVATNAGCAQGIVTIR